MEVVVVDVVDVVDVVSVGGASVVAVGIVRSGVVLGIALDISSSEPQAPSPADRASTAITVTGRGRIGQLQVQPVGAIRRPQCGQSLRSRWAS